MASKGLCVLSLVRVLASDCPFSHAYFVMLINWYSSLKYIYIIIIVVVVQLNAK